MRWVVRAWGRRYLIAACAAAAAGLAWFACGFLTKQYTARAGLTISRSRVRVKLDDRYRIVSGEEMTAPGTVALGKDLEARQRALVALISDPGIAQQVVEQCKGNLPPDLRNPAALLACVDTESSTGDLFFVRVRSGDPTLSARVANAWAKLYEARTNETYASPVGEEAIHGIDAEIARGAAALHSAAAELRSFVENSREDEMLKRISYAHTLIDGLADERAREVRDVLSRVHDARMRSVAEHLDAAFAPPAALASKGLLERLGDGLAGLFLGKNDGFDRDREARAVLARIGAHGPAPEGGVTLLSDVQVHHLDQAREEARHAVAMDDLDLIGAEREGAGKWDAFYAKVYAEMAAAEAGLSEAEGERKRLEMERDAALDQYGTLVRKKQEMTLARAVPGTEVKFVVTAVPPTRPSFPDPPLCAALAGLLGGLLAIASVCLGPAPAGPAPRVLAGRD